MTSIHISNFVRRQTPQSGFSHWTLSDEELLDRIQKNLVHAKPGYRDGVILVPVDPDGFYSSTVLLREGDKLVGEYVARKEGEEPRKSTYVVSNRHGEAVSKIEAVSVYVVLYSHAVLLEGNENDTDADYEVISVNASATDEEAPIPTGALIANHLQLSGGTATNMSDSDFVELLRKSVLYWKNKSLACPEHLRPVEPVGFDEQAYNMLNWESINPTDASVVRIQRINRLMQETVDKFYQEIENLGTTIRDEHGHLLPLPQNERERVMYLSGQISMALFVQGATM